MESPPKLEFRTQISLGQECPFGTDLNGNDSARAGDPKQFNFCVGCDPVFSPPRNGIFIED